MKSKYYKVIEVLADGTTGDIDMPCSYDTKAEAIARIQEYEEPFYQLTILEIWE